MTDLQALVASMRYVFPIRVSESHPHQELGNWCKSKDLVASGGLSADSRTLSSGKNMWSSKCLFMLSRLLSTTFFVGYEIQHCVQFFVFGARTHKLQQVQSFENRIRISCSRTSVRLRRRYVMFCFNSGCTASVAACRATLKCVAVAEAT